MVITKNKTLWTLSVFLMNIENCHFGFVGEKSIGM